MTATDPVLPWMSFFLQGSAFALVVYIVAKVFPEAMRQTREEREKRESMYREERESRDRAFISLVQALQDRFEQRNVLITAAIREQTGELSRAMTGICRLIHPNPNAKGHNP